MILSTLSLGEASRAEYSDGRIVPRMFDSAQDRQCVPRPVPGKHPEISSFKDSRRALEGLLCVSRYMGRKQDPNLLKLCV